MSLTTSEMTPADFAAVCGNRNGDGMGFGDGKDMKGTLQILNELVEAVKMLHPRMYDSLIRKLNEL